MDGTEVDEHDAAGAPSRRDLIRKAAVGGAIVWAVPTVLSMNGAAAASAQPGILSVAIVPAQPCDGSFAADFTIDISVTPDLVGKLLRIRIFWPGGSVTSCGPGGLDPVVIPSTSFATGLVLANIGTYQIGVEVSATNDCVDTLASYPPVLHPCARPPGDDVDPWAIGAEAPGSTGQITFG